MEPAWVPMSIRFGLMTPVKGGVGTGNTRESGSSRDRKSGSRKLTLQQLAQ
jgi:hypothetical protein